MKPTLHRFMICSSSLCCLLAASSWAQNQPSLDEEIIRLRKELAQTQLDCQRIGDEIDKDARDFTTYRSRSAERMRSAQAQIDTLNSEITGQTRINDSLGASISQLQSAQRQIELSQDEFRKSLITVCDQVTPVAADLPPLLMSSSFSAISLLKNDLATRAVDIAEGVTRLIGLLGRMEEATVTIQVAQESSPAPEIRGIAYRLRIGTFFEAVVDMNGQACAIFSGYDDNRTPQWRLIESAPVASAVLLGANIREGKSFPAFVELPLGPLPQGVKQ